MTYEENLRKTALELAKKMHPDKAQAGFTYEQLAQHYIPSAEYCLKKQAEIYTPLDEDNITNELKQLGLIP